MRLKLAVYALTVLCLSFHVREDQDMCFFPGSVGTSWTYEFSNGGTRTIRIAKSEVKDGAVVVTLDEEMRDKKLLYYNTIIITSSGVYQLRRRGDTFDTPKLELKLPFKNERTWEWEQDVLRKDDESGAEFKEHAVYKAVGAEEVNVPAGKFVTIKVDVSCATGLVKTQYTVWYARGVGMVKTQFNEGSLYAKQRKVDMVLKSFVKETKR